MGLETAVAITWQVMVVEEGLTPLEWTCRWTTGPAALIGKPVGGNTIIDLQANRCVNPTEFRTRSRNQPYAGMRFVAWPQSCCR